MNPYNMISVGSWSFFRQFRAGHLNAFGYLETCRYRYHLDAADLCAQHLAATDETYLAALRDALDQRGLTLANLTVDVANWFPAACSEDPALRQKHRQQLDLYVGVAERLGARSVRFDVGGTVPEITDAQIEQMVALIRSYARRAADNGYRIVAENHNNWEGQTRNIVRLAQAVDHPAFGVLAHFKNQDDPLMMPHALHVHLSPTLPLADVPGKVKAMLDRGYTGYWAIENADGNAYLEVELWIASLRRAFAAYLEEGRRPDSSRAQPPLAALPPPAS